MKRSLFVSLSLMVCFTGMVLPTQAQEARIVSIDGTPVSDVEITITRRCRLPLPPGGDLSVTKTIRSDSNGRFSYELISFYPDRPSELIHCVRFDTYTYELKKTGLTFSRARFSQSSLYSEPYTFNNLLSLIYSKPDAVSGFAVASSANYTVPLTNDMIVASFGTALSTETVSSVRLPLATTLANRRILITDSAGVVHNAKLIFVSPGQINFVTPSGMANGSAILRLLDSTNNPALKVALSEVNAAVPGLFAANANGQGPAAAQIVRVKPGNVQTFEPTVQYDNAIRQFITSAIDFGPEDNQIFLVLYGTGFRQTATVSNVEVTLGGTAGTVTYAGLQPSLDGLDQINVKLPRTLIGRGDVDLVVTIDGLYANVLRVRIK